MAGRTPYDWDALLAKARELVREGRVRPLTWKVLAEGLGIPYSTINTNFKVKFNIRSIYDLAATDTIGPAQKNTVHCQGLVDPQETGNIVSAHCSDRAAQDSKKRCAGFCPGCACHIDGRVPGSMEDLQWQQGIGIIEYTDTSENMVPIAIDDGKMIYAGREFEAQSRDAEINNMLGEILEKLAGD